MSVFLLRIGKSSSTIPKRLRVHARFDRKLLGELSSCAWTCLKSQDESLAIAN